MSQQVLMSRMGGTRAVELRGSFLLTFAVPHGASSWLVGYVAQATFRRACAHTAQKAHDKMLTGVMQSPTALF
jgi:hypothetical protein